MLTLDKDCRIGSAINTKLATEEEEPTMEIPIGGMTLERHELNALVDDATMWANWFDERAGDKLPEPTWAKKFHAFAFGHKFKDSQVIFHVGVNREPVPLVNVTLAKIKLEPMIGGLTAISLVIQCTPDMQKAAKLFNHMNHTAHIAIQIGERDAGTEKQPELGLMVDKATGELSGKLSDGTNFSVKKSRTGKHKRSNGKPPKPKRSSHVAAH